MKKVVEMIGRVCRGGLFVTMAVLTSVTVIQVVMRYVFSSPFIWAEELCRYMMIWAVMLGSTVAISELKHIRVQFLVDMFPEKTKRAVLFFVHFMSFLLSVFLTVQGYFYAVGLYRVETPALGIPTTYVAMAIPVCAVLWCVCTANNLYDMIRGGSGNM